MYKLTLKRAEGYIKSRKVVISLEYHAEKGWWINYSWLSKTPNFFSSFFLANLWFNRLVKKHGLDVAWCEDRDEVNDLIKRVKVRK